MAPGHLGCPDAACPGSVSRRRLARAAALAGGLSHHWPGGAGGRTSHGRAARRARSGCLRVVRAALLPASRVHGFDLSAARGRLGTGVVLRTFFMIAWVVWSSSSSAAEPSAKEQFGNVTTPSPSFGPAVIGGYAKGCLAGGVSLPVNGPAWQAMRLSRNRTWGHSELVGFIERLGIAARADGWPGLLVGDMAQPRGGPMRSGHASHQIGLDVDLWLVPMPDRILTAEEREKLAAPSMLVGGKRNADTGPVAEA